MGDPTSSRIVFQRSRDYREEPIVNAANGQHIIVAALSTDVRSGNGGAGDPRTAASHMGLDPKSVMVVDLCVHRVLPASVFRYTIDHTF